MPESVPSSLIIDAFKEIFQAERRGAKRQDPIGWIISVPDTHQKSVLAALDKERSLRVLTCSTEDDANAVAAGLYMTGEPVIVMIQHAGLYASVNTIRGISMDGKIPIFYMIGLLSREKDKDPKDSRHSMVRFAEPLLAPPSTGTTTTRASPNAIVTAHNVGMRRLPTVESTTGS